MLSQFVCLVDLLQQCVAMFLFQQPEEKARSYIRLTLKSSDRHRSEKVTKPIRESESKRKNDLTHRHDIREMAIRGTPKTHVFRPNYPIIRTSCFF